jgi:hypothetical protein
MASVSTGHYHFVYTQPRTITIQHFDWPLNQGPLLLFYKYILIVNLLLLAKNVTRKQTELLNANFFVHITSKTDEFSAACIVT